jgi:hypothetical protein
LLSKYSLRLAPLLHAQKTSFASSHATDLPGTSVPTSAEPSGSKMTMEIPPPILKMCLYPVATKQLTVSGVSELFVSEACAFSKKSANNEFE